VVLRLLQVVQQGVSGLSSDEVGGEGCIG